MAVPNTIILKPVTAHSRRHEEKIGSGVVKPGHLVDVTSADKFAFHAVSGGKTPVVVAVEDSYQGKTTVDNYADGDRVFAKYLLPGDQFWGWLVAGANVTPATRCSSNGDGTFKVVAGGDISLVRPKEALDNSAGGVAAWCKFEVL